MGQGAYVDAFGLISRTARSNIQNINIQKSSNIWLFLSCGVQSQVNGHESLWKTLKEPYTWHGVVASVPRFIATCSSMRSGSENWLQV